MVKKFVAKHAGVVIRAMDGQCMGCLARPMATVALIAMMLVAVAACGKMGPVEAPPDSPPFPQTYPRY
ncbi:MAG: hypothetical protein ACK5GA_07340 [Holosporaceae bacterium]|jgi:hypothetical protein